MARKLTYDDFVTRCEEIHNGKYDYSKVHLVNTRTKVDIRCNRCGTLFSQTPKNHLNGQGCPNCCNNTSDRMVSVNIGRFLKRCSERFGDKYSFPYINDEYTNKSSMITVKCNLCGSIKTLKADSFVTSKNGYCKCDKAYSYDELSSMHKEVILKRFEGLSYQNDNIILLCPIHGEYEVKTSSYVKGHYTCRRCTVKANNERKRKTYSDFIESFRYTDKITPFEDSFVSFCHKMRFKCNRCGHEFERKPSLFINSEFTEPCPKCSKMLLSKERVKTTEEFIEDVKSIYGEDVFDMSMTVYTSSSSKVTLKCNECGRIFEKEANSLLQGNGCPYHNCNSSKKEKEIVDFLLKCGLNVLTNDRTVLNGNELDIYLPDYKLAIEFDGIFWHNELNKPNDYHLNKTNMCLERGIRLIHIFEDEWIDKKDIWKSMLSNLTGHTERRIYARNCEVREIPSEECNKFLTLNHIQGKCPSTIKLGLFHKGELVSVMTFGKSRHFIGNGKVEYELLRFCNRLNTSVVGGASRLFKHFTRTYNPKSVVSYADKRWSVGNLYEKLGFTKERESRPNYHYVIGNRRMNRFNFRKSVLVEKYGCPSNMSEREFCRSMKWYRIYDCGCLCYEWKQQNYVK